MTNFKTFLRDETGAVTIDWVALTAGVLLLAIVLVFAIFDGGVKPLAGKIISELDGATDSIATTAGVQAITVKDIQSAGE